MLSIVRAASGKATASFLVSVVWAGGCAKDYGVTRIDDRTWFLRENRSALDSDMPSERTARYLRRHGLFDRLASEPEAVRRELHDRLIESRDRTLAHHLAELSFLRASALREDARSTESALACAEYAYAFLFDAGLGAEASPYDATFRRACDFYNRSLARVVRREFRPEVLASEGATVATAIGPLRVGRGAVDLAFDPKRFTEAHSAYDFDVVGFSNPARGFGIGAPCMAVRAARSIEHARIEERFLPRMKQSFACTVVLRFDGSILDRGLAGKPRTARVDVIDPYDAAEVRIGSKSVPLEFDLTTPLAFALNDAPRTSGFRVMLHVEELERTGELFMSQPYDPDRIPVVFVHGLMSAPLTWMPLFNELLGDPVLRRRYQFWFFRYSTGNPIAWSASLLRESLLEAQRTYDPQGISPTMQRMVLCGHSMGGLLSRMMVHRSGDRLWRRITDTPLDELAVAEESRELLRRALFFERLPFVRRVVFMAVPHRGADMADGFLGRLGSLLIGLPGRLVRTGESLAAGLRRDEGRRVASQLATRITGIDGLRPGALLLDELASWGFDPSVTIHSIIGNERAADTPSGSDGIVSYQSAHLDGVASEKIVQSDHSVQQHPLAIQELRRILHEHLAAE